MFNFAVFLLNDWNSICFYRSKLRESLFCFDVQTVYCHGKTLIGYMIKWSDSRDWEQTVRWNAARQLFSIFGHSFFVSHRFLMMVHNRLWIVNTNNTIGCLLNFERCFPRFMNILKREIGQLWNVLADVLPRRLQAFTEEDRIDNPRTIEEAIESWARDPHPIAGIDRPVAINQIFHQMLVTPFPADP